MSEGASTRPIRVAFLQAWLTVGGAERLVQSLMRGFDRTRVESLAINLYEAGPIGRELEVEGHRVVNGLATSRLDPRLGVRLARTLEREQVDVVYVFDSALPMFWSGVVRRWRVRPRLVLGFHSTGKLGDPLQHWLARRTTIPVADRLIALAEPHRRFLSRELGVPVSRFEVVRSGVDLEAFDPRLDRVEARRRTGLPQGVPLAGMIVALRPEKNLSLFLDAASKIAASLPDARFVIAGDGPYRDGLERECRERGLTERVLRLGMRRDVADLYRALDVAVLTSHPIVETLPVTLLEAAACATPAVSTRVGSVEDIVVDGETGFLVAPGDSGGLAQRLESLLRDDSMREHMGLAARERVERHFDRRAMIESYQRLFIDIAREIPGVRP